VTTGTADVGSVTIEGADAKAAIDVGVTAGGAVEVGDDGPALTPVELFPFDAPPADAQAAQLTSNIATTAATVGLLPSLGMGPRIHRQDQLV
jgi:hypothetical protein